MGKFEKAYIPNLDLELTPQAEIKRLRKVIDEKNELIAKFKAYDAKRTEEFHRLQQNMAVMEEQYNEWREEVSADCGEYAIKGLERLRKRTNERNQRALSCINGLKDVMQVLPNVLAMLREMLAFAETRNPYQETFYKTKINSVMSCVDKLLTRCVGYANMFDQQNKGEAQ